MQFINMHQPRDTGNANAFGAASDIVDNLLNVYTGYQSQKRQDARQAVEDKFKQDEMALRSEEHRRNMEAADLQKQEIARRYQEQALDEGIEGTRGQVKTGERTVDAAPDFQVDAKKPDAATPFGSPKLDTMLGSKFAQKPLFNATPQQPTRTEDIMGTAPIERRTIAAIKDSSGNIIAPEKSREVLYRDEVQKRNAAGLLEQEIATGKQVRLTPGERALMHARGIGGDREVVPATVYDDFVKLMGGGGASAKPPEHIVDKRTGRVLGWNPESQGFDKQLAQLSPEVEKKEKDPFEVPAGVESVVAGDISTIPVALRGQVRAIAEGRQAPPSLGNRPGSPGFHLMAYVNAYDPDASFEATQARWKAHNELSKGSGTSRGGQMTNLNTFADHLDILQSKADELNAHLANSDWSSLNALDQRFTRSSKRGPMTGYTDAANTFVTEYIKTLKGAAPTNVEQAEFNKIRDTTLSPAERQASIDTLKEFVESRANEQETWYTQQFGRPSADDRTAGVKGRPFLGGRWTWDGTRWSIPRGGSASAPGQRDPVGVLKSGEKTLGNPQAGNPLGISR